MAFKTEDGDSTKASQILTTGFTNYQIEHGGICAQTKDLLRTGCCEVHLDLRKEIQEDDENCTVTSFTV
jgi:hypothetical protein